MSATTAPAFPRAASPRREPILPLYMMREQGAFALISWVAITLFAFAVTYVVSLFRPIEVSGWDMFGQAVRWFAFAMAIHLGYTTLPLHVAHGGTRRGYFVHMLVFTLFYVVLLAILYALSFLIEAVYYGLMGWPHVLHQPAFYQSGTDVPMVVLFNLLILPVWFAAGFALGAGYYRSFVIGSVLIVVGVAAASLSSLSVSSDSNFVGAVWLAALVPPEPSVWLGLSMHTALTVLFLGLAWLVVRDMPIRTKSEQGS